ncbi:MAG: tetratricopeptide repeat protein [Sedimentisphaerales bacterium]|nr:tetratricopeptide repeat protein [Sedimentisphaerales bacterium]
MLCSLLHTTGITTHAQVVDPNSIQTSNQSQSPQDPNITNNAPQQSTQPSQVVNTDKNSFQFTPSKGFSTDVGRDLWQARITAGLDPNDEKNSIVKGKLQELMATIRSVKFKNDPSTPKPEQKTEPVIDNEPNLPTEKPNKKTLPKPQIPQPKTNSTTVADSNSTLLTVQTLTILQNQIQTSAQIQEPFELAEVLYISGHLPEAAIAYKQALIQMDLNDKNIAPKRAWSLMQIGNCLRNTNPQEAMQSYQQLINEHPDSQWMELAKTMNELVGWYTQEKPKDLIDASQYVELDQ